MKILLVFNPQSGSALSKEELAKKCANAGLEVEKLIPIGGGFERKLKKHITAGKNIAVIGGDGTVSAVAGQVAGTKATLIPLPGGTLNHFTKDLEVPQDIDTALAELKDKTPRAIDIARVNSTYFINNSSLGIYPSTLHDREDIQSKTGKWPAAIIASVKALVRLRTYTLEINGEIITTPFVFIGNNRYVLDNLGGTKRSSLDEGILTVFVAKTQSRLTLLKIALFALIGKTRQLSEFDEFYVTSLTIRSNHSRLSVSHDGEVTKIAPPLTYTVEAKSLHILA